MKLQDLLTNLENLKVKYNTLGQNQLELSVKLSNENNPVIKGSYERQIDSILCEMIDVRSEIRYLKNVLASADESYVKLKELKAQYKSLGDEQLEISNKLSHEHQPTVRESFERQIDSLLCNMIDLRDNIRALEQTVIEFDFNN